MLLEKITLLAILVVSSLPFVPGSQRPFFIIGHMVNAIDVVETFLKFDCNVLEFDVRFHSDGSVKHVRHGHPCDMGRVCNDTADLDEYLEYIKNLTNPCAKPNFNKQLVMLFFDLKLAVSENKTRSGVDVLRNIVDHLWISDKRKQQVKVLLYIERANNSDFIIGFLNELKNLGLEHRLKDVGFDGGFQNWNRTREMFKRLNASVNVWHGEGITNVFRTIRGDEKLEHLVSARDAPNSFIQKIYDWTVDKKVIMRRALRLGVDGIITNEPKSLSEVLQEPEFEGAFRLATIDDDPFSRFEG